MNRAYCRATIHPAHSRRGLTLVELLVVIGVIGLLLMMLLPMIRTDRGAARRANCSSRMRQVAIAVLSYSAQNQDAIPVGVYPSSRYTAQTLILPFLEHTDIYKRFGSFTSTADASAPATSQRIPDYVCPSDNPTGTYASPGGGRYAQSNFVFCFGAETMEPPAEQDQGVFRVGRPALFQDMATDGSSNTVMVSETIAGKAASDSSGAWGYGEAGACGYTHKNQPNNGPVFPPVLARSASDFSQAVGTASSQHPGLVNVIYADMHSSQISINIDPAIWRAMATVAGGEPYTAP